MLVRKIDLDVELDERKINGYDGSSIKGFFLVVWCFLCYLCICSNCSVSCINLYKEIKIIMFILIIWLVLKK